ncbi:uncharacterized protein EV420DRAFT_248621 [Desarmillaria tabescens]|uniref:Uncharacterized protein n=1 Tax=Armillaria tabescens TaxID=1929756 RepID=A0AA39KF56_ARMTA|nr:uncharacterized protein EV420DRAFT_248621 [Desarmillaria tabescens]KAK0460041.1 hypothetical protein EV420DRAFT_248621 [Desarmillaria tabescens]
MPNILSRFRRRATSLPVTEVAEQQPATPGPSTSQSEAVLNQKIHPNLADLVNDFPPVFFSQPTPIPQPSRPSTSTERDDGIIPLKPARRTRRRSSDTSAKQNSIAPTKVAGQLEKLPESPTPSHPALPDSVDVPHDIQQVPSHGVSTRNDSTRDNDDGITPAVPSVTRRRSDASAIPSTTAVRPLDDLHPSRTPSHPASSPDASDITHDIIYSDDCDDPTRSPSSLSVSSFQETADPSHENSSSPTGSGTFGVFTRLTNFVHGSPVTPLTQSPNPPSSWSTFGRRAIRGERSTSHTTDVGTSSRPSSSGTSHSHTPPSTTRSRIGTPDDTPGSAFGSISSPSSGFTFGSHGPGPRAVGSSPPPPLPPLSHPAFSTLDENNSNVAVGNDGSKDEETAFFSDHGPRPSSSMPAMRSSSQPSSSWLTESSSRPRLQDIFSSPVSSPAISRRTSRRSTVSRGSNRQRRHRSKSASSSRKRGESGGERHDISGQGSRRAVLTPSENGNQARGNSSSQVFNLGSPFLFQGISVGAFPYLPTVTSQATLISGVHDPSVPPSS